MKTFRFPVEAGQVLQFARAIGDSNPVYTDPDSPAAKAAGGVLAPPTFTQAADHYEPGYIRRPEPGVAWFGSGTEPISATEGAFNTEGGSGFHAEQRFEYHQPVRPGQMLTVEVKPGNMWEKDGRRGGKLKFTETVQEFRDESGALVVTATFVGVTTEKRVDG
ncbi:MAG: MaoC family dehydratase N-terminal domain-containing protein [Candidatus Binatia bacterium]|nr:MaoC family dehydratase N-terminal domain-containing protein [Candidatus Binatia bacterium]